MLFISQKHQGVEDPLEVVAGEISDEAILLCLDEFMVSKLVFTSLLRIISGYLILVY